MDAIAAAAGALARPHRARVATARARVVAAAPVFAYAFAFAFAFAFAGVAAAQPSAPAAPAADAGPSARSPARDAAVRPPPDTLEQRMIACTVCHGTQDVIVKGGYYPRLYGKPAGYLYNQLMNFQEGRRTYPLMTYLVGHLPEPYLREIADWFAGQHPPYPPPEAPTASRAVLERGRQLVFDGDPGRDVPACASCHGQALTGVAPAIPGLLGLPRDYVSAQFGAWRNQARRAHAPDCMAQVAQRLSGDDIAAAAAWLAAQPVPGQALPADRLPAPLPLPCGGVDPSARADAGPKGAR